MIASTEIKISLFLPMYRHSLLIICKLIRSILTRLGPQSRHNFMQTLLSVNLIDFSTFSHKQSLKKVFSKVPETLPNRRFHLFSLCIKKSPASLPNFSFFSNYRAFEAPWYTTPRRESTVINSPSEIFSVAPSAPTITGMPIEIPTTAA